MSFFEHQERARRNTKLLVALYIFTVLCIIAGTYLVLVATWELGMQSGDQKLYRYTQPATLWHPQAFFWITGITVVLVLFGSLMKRLELAKGGEAVARMLGGQPIFPNTQDYHEKRALNVVEEMAIASGIAVPKVFVLPEERGINAFAAGYSPKDAVIGVTKGCIQNLSRDELQGVIAHEFSHILNGDMRLNIRLVSVLAGIMVISMVGYALWRIGIQSPAVRRSHREKDNSRAAFFVAGMALYVLGYLGALGARMIQSAVSRQREFLADASAVQFTRNPLGISHALQKIGALVYGSKVEASHAQEVGHFFFANGVSGFLGRAFATHPPLDERIRRIDPSFKGFSGEVSEGFQIDEGPDAGNNAVAGLAGSTQTRIVSSPSSSLAASITSQVGTLQDKHVQVARTLLDSMPMAVTQAVRQPQGAKAVVLALLADRDSAIFDKQRAVIAQAADTEITAEFERLNPSVAKLGLEYRLPLLELTIPTLHGLTPNDYVRFRQLVQRMVEIDQKCSIFEYSLQQVLRRALDWRFIEGRANQQIRPHKPHPESPHKLLGSLALLCNSDFGQAQAAFERGGAFLTGAAPLQKEWGSLTVFDAALQDLQYVSFAEKEAILPACVAAVTADGLVSVEEAELIRALADGLECPLPPLHEL